MKKQMIIHIFEFKIDFKNSVEEIRSEKSKILATVEVVICCFNFSSAKTYMAAVSLTLCLNICLLR